jgi:AmmeMemoRadiSam system protein B
VAGSFYPGSPERLREAVGRLLAGAGTSGSTPPKALIAPHAGYSYSGAVAAAAFATLRSCADRIRRVVLIGPAHYVRLRGLALPTATAFETPLGRVPVSQDAPATLADLGQVGRVDTPHRPEHALEVELPFLQSVLPPFDLVPLLVGDTTGHEVAEVLGHLWGGPETLIVVSSDLSHFHSYEEACRRDAATAAAIERGDWAQLGPEDACGFLAVAGLLIEAARHRLTVRRLSLCNSGDTAGPRSSVVGYGSWALAHALDAS